MIVACEKCGHAPKPIGRNQFSGTCDFCEQEKVIDRLRERHQEHMESEAALQTRVTELERVLADTEYVLSKVAKTHGSDCGTVGALDNLQASIANYHFRHGQE